MQPIEISAGSGTQVATGAILVALIDHLVEAGTLKSSDARTILNNAVAGLSPRETITSVIDATAFIKAMLPRYSK